MNFPSSSDAAAQGASGASSLWTRFRSWPWWGQALLWLIWPVPLILLALSKPADQRRQWWALAVVGSVVWFTAGISSSASSGHQKLAAAAPATPTSTTEQHGPSTTTATLPAATDGLRRSGSGADIGTASAGADIDRSLTTDTLLTTLASLTVEPEHARTGYNRDLFPHWDDVDHDSCDTRCEVLSAQRRTDGSWLSEWDGYITSNTSELHVDHVVALAEAWDSGADRWTAAQRDEFADFAPNLLAVTASENLRKSDSDASEWFPARSEANCLWSSTVVRVKAQWSLSVDPAERDALVNLLHTCTDFVAPTTITVPPITVPPTTAKPFTPTTPPPTTTPVNDCTPGYDPCIPPGPDVDCAGGSGNGPRYVDGPVSVTGSDPYGLDNNNDGVGCE
ncbi:MAG: hypothetical protein QOI95_1133 [Acidimicrobiaceae bacterium]